ncbi:MAG: hypothetical protein P8188_04600 [Gemmatimonadota bacterium]
MDSRSRWRDRLGDEVVCVVCGEVRDSTEVDRMLWCEGCRARVQARAARIGLYVGVGVAAALAAWIWLVIQPSRLIAGAWIATVVAAGWLGAKIGREVAYGVFRARETPAGGSDASSSGG